MAGSLDYSEDSVSDIMPQPFRFLDLPAELRRCILESALCVHHTIDLDPANGRDIVPRLGLLLTSRKVHDEAYPLFYGSHTFRLFPTHGRFFGDKVQPILTRLSSHYRAVITSLELRLGPGWNKPPKTWTVDHRLGLEDAVSVRTLKIFAECDPSHGIFQGFRMVEPSFTDFAELLLGELIRALPSLEIVQFDGYSFISKYDPLISRLLQLAKAESKIITWGTEAAWSED